MLGARTAKRLVAQGDELLGTGDLDGAEAAYRRAWERDRSSANAVWSIGCVASHRGDFEASLDWGRRALKLDARHLGALALVGNGLLALERHEEAIPYLQAAAQSNHAAAHAQLGLCLEALNRLPEAEACLRELLEQDASYRTRHDAVGVYSHSPFWADVHHALARVLQGQGKLDEARLHYHLTKRIDPETVLDPRYLEIMSTEALEDHPFEEETAEAAAPEGADELTRQILELLRARDYDELVERAARYDQAPLVARLAGMIEACQVTNDFAFAAQLRPIGDVVDGTDARELHRAVLSPPWRRVFELAQRVAEDRMDAAEAAAAVRASPPDDTRLLLDLVRRFVALDARSGAVLAELVAAGLEAGEDEQAGSLGLQLVGRARIRCGDAHHAEEAFQRALEIADARHDDNAAHDVLGELWPAQAECHDVAGAERSLQRRIAHATAHGDRESELVDRDNLGTLLLRADRATEAYDIAAGVAEAVAAGDGSDELAEHVVALLEAAAEATGRSVPAAVLSGLRAHAGQAAGGHTLAATTQAFVDRGFELAERGDDVEARDALERGIRRAEYEPRFDAYGALMKLSTVCARSGDLDAAIEAAKRALAHAERNGDLEHRAAAHEQLAQLTSDQDPKVAAHHVERAQTLRAPPRGVRSDRLRTLEELAFAAHQRAAAGAPVDAVLEQMQAAFDALREPAERCDGGLLVGEAALDAYDHVRAQTVLDEVVAIASQASAGNAAAEIRARALLGTSYRQTGRHAEAREQYVIGIQRATAIHDELAECDLHGRLGIALRQLGDVDAALSEYDRAIEIAVRNNESERVAVNKMNRATALFELSRHEAAIADGLAAWRAFERHASPEMALRTLLLLKQRAPDALPPEALARLQDLLAEDPGGHAHVTLSYSALARRDAGDVEAARAELTQAIDVLRAKGDRVEVVRAVLNRARVLAEDDPVGAAADAEEALALATALHSAELEVAALEVAVDLALASGRVSELVDRLRAHDRSVSVLRRQLSRDVDRVALAGRTADGLKQCAVSLLLADDAEAAACAFELGRAAAFGDLLSTATAEADAVWPDPFDLSPARELLGALGPDAVAVAFDIVQGQVGATVLDARGVVDAGPIGVDETEVERLVADFRREVIKYQGRAAQTWPARAATLLEPVAESLAHADTVVLLLDSALHELPLHAVAMPDGRRLIDWASVLYAPSLHALAHVRRRPSPHGPMTVTAIGVAFPDEARAVSLRTGGGCLSSRRLDKDVVRDFAARAKVLHFACHGFFDGRTPLDSGLLLTTSMPPALDDVLSIRDIAQWNLHADLVTLSACETGLGQPVPADFLSLARSFMGVGARSVIASLWPVDDAATQRLMLSFYDELERQKAAAGGVNVAAAMRTAQRAWADGPLYDWAAFKVMGWPSFEWAAV